jgi:hypothetical protein
MPFYHNINKRQQKLRRGKERNNEVGELVHLWVLWWRSEKKKKQQHLAYYSNWQWVSNQGNFKDTQNI